MILNGSALNTGPINGEIELSLRSICDIARMRIESDLQLALAVPVQLGSIDHRALDQARAWRRKYHRLGLQEREPGWDWKDEFYTRSRRSSYIDLAIWSEHTLCGLMIGQVSDGRVNATIHFIESDPELNPLKGEIIDIVTRFLEAIAALVGCEHALISKPIPDLIERYKSFGYTEEKRKRRTVTALIKRLPDSALSDHA